MEILLEAEFSRPLLGLYNSTNKSSLSGIIFYRDLHCEIYILQILSDPVVYIILLL